MPTVSHREREMEGCYVTVKGRQTDKQVDKAAHGVTVRLHKVYLSWETEENQPSV